MVLTLDRVMAAMVAIALGYLAVVAWRNLRHRRGPARYDEPVVVPQALRVVASGTGLVLLPGSVVPYELHRPDVQTLFLEANGRSRVIGVAPDVPASGHIACAARVMEARREGGVVHAIVLGAARVRLTEQRPSSEWSVELVTDTDDAKQRAGLAATHVRLLALRVIDRLQPFPGAAEQLRSAVDPADIVDIAAACCDLPREAQTAVLATEDLPARAAVVRRALEARRR
jgi:Lon protease-like protein